jgi:hypothetical protein
MPGIREVCDEVAVLLERKREDYGSAERTLGRWGLLGILVRMGDKYERLVSLIQAGRKPNFESVRDTLLDLAGYAVLGVMLLEKEAEPQ